MEFLHNIITSYSSFFSIDTIHQILSSPGSWGIIASLIILEGLLSADNALVLAVIVKHLPKSKRKKALFYGILGAFLFRFVAIGVGVILVKMWWLKVIGAAYLLWMVAKNFIQKGEEEEAKGKEFGFWKTILIVELMDIAFSIDSVIASLGVSNQQWVLFLGGILGIIMMRGVAQVFLLLIERIPEFETTAFVLIAIIAIKMLASVIGYEMKDIYFFAILVIVFLGTFIVHMVNERYPKKVEKNLS